MQEDDIDTIDDETEVYETELNEVLYEEKPKKRQRTAKEPKEYVNKDEMWQEIFNYYILLGGLYDWEKQKLITKNMEYHVPISLYLTRMIDDIATKMGYRPNFLNYSYLDEMRGDARTKMFKAIRDCSFKCYTTTKVEKEIIKNGINMIYYYDKKGKLQDKPQEATDVFDDREGVKYITFRANAFGYYSRIASHAFLNRIKKEKLIDATKKAYQGEIWEKMLTTENFQCVRRPRVMSDYDENDAAFDSNGE